MASLSSFLFCTLLVLMEILLIIGSVANREHQPSPSKRLTTDLIENYGPRSVLPVRSQNKTTEVFFRPKAAWFAEFDERKQVATFTSVNKYKWTDEYLTWDPADYDGVEETYFQKDQIWFPDIAVYERVANIEKHELNVEDTVIRVNYKGEAVYYYLGLLSTYCKMDVSLFPYDAHKCKIRYLPYAHSMDEVHLRYPDGLDAREVVLERNGVWSVTEIEVEEVIVDYLCCPIPFSEIHITMHIRRESLFFIRNLGLPTFLLSITTLSVFLLHPESGEKISLCVNNILALILFQQLLSANMPPTGDHTPIVAVYFIVVICVGFLSVITTCLTLGVYHTRGKRPLPDFIRVILFMKQTDRRKTYDREDSVSNEKLLNDWDQTDETIDGIELSSDPWERRGSTELTKRVARGCSGAPSTGPAPTNFSGNEAMSTTPSSPETNHRPEWVEAAFRFDRLLFVLTLSTLIFAIIYCFMSFLHQYREIADGNGTE